MRLQAGGGEGGSGSVVGASLIQIGDLAPGDSLEVAFLVTFDPARNLAVDGGASGGQVISSAQWF
ncbi:MAG: hypothetical protein IPH10_09935 [bacterium]|nr:hypothetical protein [bacterium]